LQRGTINLNPPGRTQTKKRRPVLPMPKWLRPWIETAHDGPLVAFRGKPVKKIAGAIQTQRDGAGFGPGVTAYTIRHSIATELAARGVPELETATILGHRMVSNRTTGRYLHEAPEHLARARKALDAIAKEIGRAATRPMKPDNVRANCVLAPGDRAATRSLKPYATGTAVGTRERNSLGCGPAP
jgi:integrase